MHPKNNHPSRKTRRAARTVSAGRGHGLPLSTVARSTGRPPPGGWLVSPKQAAKFLRQSRRIESHQGRSVFAAVVLLTAAGEVVTVQRLEAETGVDGRQLRRVLAGLLGLGLVSKSSRGRSVVIKPTARITRGQRAPRAAATAAPQRAAIAPPAKPEPEAERRQVKTHNGRTCWRVMKPGRKTPVWVVDGSGTEFRERRQALAELEAPQAPAEAVEAVMVAFFGEGYAPSANRGRGTARAIACHLERMAPDEIKREVLRRSSVLLKRWGRDGMSIAALWNNWDTVPAVGQSNGHGWQVGNTQAHRVGWS